MYRITIICVGKIKEKFFDDAIAEYQKRLRSYAEFKVIEVKDEPLKENASAALRNEALNKEGTRLNKYLRDKAYNIALAIEGKKMDSLEFSETIKELANNGISEICFFIGSSLGLSKEILKKCDMKLSFSAMTFPHQLMRVILTEQIYRAFRIINNQPYHK